MVGYGANSRALKEVQTLSEISHPRIVQMVASWVDPSKDLNIIADLYGSPLDAYVCKHGKQEFRVIRKWARQLVEALCFLHDGSCPLPTGT